MLMKKKLLIFLQSLLSYVLHVTEVILIFILNLINVVILNINGTIACLSSLTLYNRSFSFFQPITTYIFHLFCVFLLVQLGNHSLHFHYYKDDLDYI
jgi:hypothetical protein